MLIIVTALFIEAKPIIDWLGMKKDHSINSHQVYRNDSVSLIISGIGNLNAAIASTILITEFPESKLVKKPLVFNIGFCASKENEIGSLYLINKISYLNQDYYPELNLNFKTNESALVTVDIPVDNTDLMDDNVLYEMEAYGIYSATSKLIDCTSAYFFKIIADNGKDCFYSKEKAAELYNLNQDRILRVIEMLIKSIEAKSGMLIEDYYQYLKIIKNSNLSVTQTNLLTEPILTALNAGVNVSDILFKLKEVEKINKKEVTPFVEAYINSLNI